MCKNYLLFFALFPTASRPALGRRSLLSNV